MAQNLQHCSFYGILDTGYVSPDEWIAKYDALAEGGATIIQIRAKNASPDELMELTRSVVEHRARTQNDKGNKPYLIINDSLEVALAFPDLGLHVGQDDLPAPEARRTLGPDRILGLSTHSPTQADQAMELGPEVLSYFAVGPVFPTQTKPDYTPVGLKLVRYVSDRKPELPFFCIGGINRHNIDQVRKAGARRIVTVSDVLCDLNTTSAVAESIQQIKG